MRLLLPILLPIFGGAVIFTIKDDKLRRTLCSGVTVLAVMSAASCALVSETESVTLLRLSDTLSLSFGVDSLSRFFLLLVAFVFLLVLFYGYGYMKHEGGESRFFGFYLITMGTLFALSMAENAVTLYMCFELMTLMSMPMVLHNGSEASRKAAIKYLGFSALGAAMALMGFFLAAQYAESLTFVPGGTGFAAGHESLLTAAYFLMTLGFGAKAGIVPLQAWLTAAHPVAPSPASAVLSGVITKGGVLAILRVTFYLFGAERLRDTWAVTALTVLALATVFTGSMLALKEKLLKRRLAYSTISQVSYVLFGILLLTKSSFTGAFLQIVFHSLAKDALFLAAGAIIFATGCTRVEELRGIGRKMPVTLWCFAIASLSLIGIPPTGGFIAKWQLAMGALERGDVLGVVGVAVLLLSALLTAFYLLPIVSDGFFPGKDFGAVEKTEVERGMLLPMVVLAALTVLLGAFPGALSEWLFGLAETLL